MVWGINKESFPGACYFWPSYFRRGKSLVTRLYCCLKDRRPAPGQFYLLCRHSFILLLESVYHLSSMLGKTTLKVCTDSGNSVHKSSLNFKDHEPSGS